MPQAYCKNNSNNKNNNNKHTDTDTHTHTKKASTFKSILRVSTAIENCQLPLLSRCVG